MYSTRTWGLRFVVFCAFLQAFPRICVCGRLNNVGKLHKNCPFPLDERKEKWYDNTMENNIEINRRIAKNLIHYRKAAGLTQAGLAEKINYSDKSISKWESGNGVPDIYTLIQLAELFGVSVDALIGDNTPVNPKKKTIGLHWLIMLLSGGIIWLVATCFFVLMQLIARGGPWWLAFVYAVPINAIVLLVYASIWHYRTLNFISVSTIIWMSITCLFLTVKIIAAANGLQDEVDRLWLLFLLGIPLQVLEILWVFFRSFFRKSKRMLSMQTKIIKRKEKKADKE